MSLQQLRNRLALSSCRETAQARQSFRAVLPLHTHGGELQVRVHMVRINRHCASKTFFSFLGIARGQIVVPEIVQYNGRSRRDL